MSVSRLDDDTINAIRSAVGAELDKRARIDAEVHAADHAWVREKRHCETRASKRAERIMESVIGWGVIGSLSALAGFIGWAVLTGVKDWLGRLSN